MRKRHWISLVLFCIFIVGLQACGRKYDPQEACNFVQSSNMQRVSWKAELPVRMMVHSSVPVSSYGAIERAVNRWNKDFGRELIRIDAWGVGGSAQPGQDGYNLIYWMENWESNRANEQARTTIYWHGNQIFEADLRLNAKFNLYPAASGPIAGVDLESLVLHELGHVMGLAHNSKVGSVMNVSLNSGQDRRTPDHQDIHSLSCEY